MPEVFPVDTERRYPFFGFVDALSFQANSFFPSPAVSLSCRLTTAVGILPSTSVSPSETITSSASPAVADVSVPVSDPASVPVSASVPGSASAAKAADKGAPEIAFNVPVS